MSSDHAQYLEATFYSTECKGYTIVPINFVLLDLQANTGKWCGFW